MGSLNPIEVLVFLDYLIVFSEIFEEQEHECAICMSSSGVRSLVSSYLLRSVIYFKTSVKSLDYVVSENVRKRIDPEKIAPLPTWPRPNNIRELKSFLGFTG